MHYATGFEGPMVFDCDLNEEEIHEPLTPEEEEMLPPDTNVCTAATIDETSTRLYRCRRMTGHHGDHCGVTAFDEPIVWPQLDQLLRPVSSGGAFYGEPSR